MTDKRDVVLISVDHKWRDLAGYVYAKLLLERLGYRAILIRHGFEEYYAYVYSPRAVVMIHLYDRKKNALIKRLKQRAIQVFLMPTEGIPTIENVRKLAAGYYSDLSDVDIQFVWNHQMRKLMEDGGVIDPDRLRVIGVPRFDFYRAPLSALPPSKEQFAQQLNLDPHRPIIAWATNFTNAQFHENNSNFLKKDWKRLQVDRVLDPIETAARDHASRQIHFDSVARLAKEMDNVNVIVKLHPSEDHTYYYRKLGVLPSAARERIRIIHQRYIWDVLSVTDVLLGRSCTTEVEGWLLGKPTIELRLNPDEWYYSQEHSCGSNEVTSYDELRRWVEHYLSGGEISETLTEHRKAFINKWCDTVDGQSTKRFVRIIHETIQAHSLSKHLHPKQWRWRLPKSLAIVSLMELTNFRIHNLKVYGVRGMLDKLGRYDKYFDRTDEKLWMEKISPLVEMEEVQ